MANDFKVTNWQIVTYETNVRHALQQAESRLESAVTVDNNARSYAKAYPFIGKAEMVEYTRTAPVAPGDTLTPEVIPLVGRSFDRSWLVTTPYTYNDFLESEDTVELFTDPKSSMVEAAVKAAMRQKDNTIITALNAANTSRGGNEYANATSTAFAGTTVGDGTGALDLDMLLDVKEAMDIEEVPKEERYLVHSARQLKGLLSDTKLTSSDFNTVKSLVRGEIDQFLNFRFISTELLPWATNVRTCFAFWKQAVLLGMCESVNTKVAEVPQWNFNTVIQTKVRLGGTRLYDAGVVKISVLETHA